MCGAHECHCKKHHEADVSEYGCCQQHGDEAQTHECKCGNHNEEVAMQSCKCGKQGEEAAAHECKHHSQCDKCDNKYNGKCDGECDGECDKKLLEAVATSQAPAALGAYSQAVKANGFVFVSGQLGINPATGELAGATAAEQAKQALNNIAAILEAAGSSTDRIVRATIYLADVADFQEVDTVYAAALTGAVKPARVAFGGNAIPKGALVEIDAIAAL